jgi:nucleoside-diphosphate kinase
MPLERTLVIIKPDALQRTLVGEIVSRLERKGLRLVGFKMIRLSEEILFEHYSHLSKFDFFGEIKNFMSSRPVLVSCWEGVDCVETVRRICGTTKAREANPGTIRGDLAMSVQANLVHASDSRSSADAEIMRFFDENELFSYEDVLQPFLYSEREISEG